MNFRDWLFDMLDSLPAARKIQILLLLDLVVVAGAYYSAITLRLNDLWPTHFLSRSVPLLVLLLVSAGLIGHFLNNYAIKLRSYEINSITRSAVWAALLALIGFVANIVFSMGMPRTVPIIFGPLAFFLAVSLRIFAVGLLNWLGSGNSKRIPVAIYGAGSVGLQLISALRNSSEYQPVVLIDDDRGLQRMMISGLRVQPPSVLVRYARKGRIKEVFLAFPNLTTARRNQILANLKDLDCAVSELPPYENILRSGGLVPSLRPIEADDLLGRVGVDLNVPELQQQYAGSSIMISGAGGSIGSELCRKVLNIGARRIVLFERSELALYQINQELTSMIEAANLDDVELIPVLGSISDEARVVQVLTDYEIEIVLHAAAYKHVPLVEANKCEGVSNNVFGTKTLAEAAVGCGVKRFIMISTDKAVRPTGTMGASKRLAELVIQDIQARNSDCVFGIVRFGNVLGSSGSVIPLFREQIKSGGPVTLTHSDVTRYFMTINEAAFLVLLAGTYAENGEVFVLDMGEPVRIEDLAKRMITLSGLTVRNEANPNGDIEIELTGLREGEKLFEELLVGSDSLPTPHSKILRAQEKTLSSKDIRLATKKLQKAVLHNDTEQLELTLKQFVEEFH